MKRVLIGGYLLVMVCFAIYGSLWGQYAYKGFANNLGRSLVWPVMIVPGLGQALGALLLVGFVLFVTMKKE